MRKLLALGIALSVTLGSMGVLAAVTADDLAPRVETLETQVAELREIHDLNGSPTEEPTETETATETATETETETATATETETEEPDECSVPDGADVWHAPTDHEHGDAPPAWADEWSCQQFGHPVIFGGDEQTPDENLYKHNAFKGYTFSRMMLDGSTADFFVRLHAQSNPHGRAGRYHSYEIYVRDASDNISFWQGWLDFGEAPEHRYSHTTDNLIHINNNLGIGTFIFGFDENTHSVVNAREDWYSRNDAAEWSWTVEIMIRDPATYINPDSEHLTAEDRETWEPTGWHGLDRVIRIRWIAGGSNHAPVADRNLADPRGWFCAAVTGEIVSEGSPDCDEGIPQHIAETMPETHPRYGVFYGDKYTCAACELPN